MHSLMKKSILLVLIVSTLFFLISCWEETGDNSTTPSNSAPQWTKDIYIDSCERNDTLIIDLQSISIDSDADSLMFSISETSPYATLSDGYYSVIAPNDTTTGFSVDLIVSDGTESDTATLNINFFGEIITNSAPQWKDTVFSYTITKGEKFSIDLSKISSDADSNKLSYSIVNSSSIDTIIDSIYTIVADSTSISPYTAYVLVSDSDTSDTARLIFTLLEPNKPPVFTDDKPKILYEIEEGDSVEFTVEATDPDINDSVKIGIDTLGLLPNSSNALLTNGLFKWKSTAGESGSYVITFYATDGEDTTKTDVTIKVGEANIIPTISVADSISGGSVRVAEGDTLTTDFIFNDLDVTDSLTISSKLPSIEGLSFVTKGDSAATLTFSPNYKTVINDSIKVIDSITISVSDGEDQADFKLIITVVNTNRKPVFTDNSPADLYTVISGNTLEIPFLATDADSEDNVIITVDTTTFKQGANITVSGNKIIWSTVFGDIGTDSITLSASDGEDVTNKIVAVVVNEDSTAPTITVTATEDTVTITEIDSTGFVVSAVPVVEGDVVTLACSSNLPDSVISFNASSGEFSFKANYDMASLSNPDTVFAIKFTAKGSGANASVAEYSQFIKVTNVNRLPYFNKLPDIDSIMVHSNYNTALEVNDLDGDNIQLSLSSNPALPTTIVYNNQSKNAEAFIDRTKFKPGDQFTITVSISDGSGVILDSTWNLVIKSRTWTFKSFTEDEIFAVYPRDSLNVVKISKLHAWTSENGGQTFNSDPFYTVPNANSPVYYNIINLGNIHIIKNNLVILRNTYSPGMPNTALELFDYFDDGTIIKDTTYLPQWIMAYDFYMNDNGNMYTCGIKSSHGGMLFSDTILDSISTVGTLREVVSSKSGDYLYFNNDSNIVRNNKVLSNFDNILNHTEANISTNAKLYMQGGGDTLFIVDSSNNTFVWSINAKVSKDLVSFNSISTSPSIASIGIRKIVLNSSNDGWLLDSSGKLYFSNDCFQTLNQEITKDNSGNDVIISNLFPSGDKNTCFAIGTSINGKIILRY